MNRVVVFGIAQTPREHRARVTRIPFRIAVLPGPDPGDSSLALVVPGLRPGLLRGHFICFHALADQFPHAMVA